MGASTEVVHPHSTSPGVDPRTWHASALALWLSAAHMEYVSIGTDVISWKSLDAIRLRAASSCRFEA